MTRERAIRIACSVGLPLLGTAVWLLWGTTVLMWFIGALFFSGAVYTCPAWDFWEEDRED